MVTHRRRLPFPLDPLIAEAKRRAWARRFLLAALVLVVGGAVAATVVPRLSEPSGPAITSWGTCASSQLELVPGRGGAAAGTAMRDFALVNASAASCRLHGWPSLQLVLGNGRVITPRVVRDHYYGPEHMLPARTIRLGSGGAASFRIAEPDGTGFGIQTCRTVKTLLVTPPGTSKAFAVPHGAFYCAPYGLSEVPLVAGRVDRYSGW